jgi:hypothetical protein
MSKNDQDKNFWLNVGLRMFAESTGWIAIPVVGALYLGRYLDEKQNTGNLYFFSLTALAFIISCVGLSLIGMKYLKMLDQDKEKKKDNESKQ